MAFNFKSKRKIMLVVAIVVVGFIAYVVSTATDVAFETKTKDETIKNIITDTNTRKIGLDSLAVDVGLMKKENKELAIKFDNLNSKMEKIISISGTTQDVGFQLKSLSKLMTDLSRNNTELKAEIERFKYQTEEKLKSTINSVNLFQAEAGNVEINDSIGSKASEANYFETEDGELVVDASAVFSNGISIASKPELSEEEKAAEAAALEAANQKEISSLYLPAGSILTGVLINGIDAPTGSAARKDPFPVTIRLKKEALLPNSFTGDVRECFLIASGYGDLSSERAYLRSETISCIREDGGAVETAIDAYTVGEDGKAGIRGRLVSKQGQIIAKSLMAGFLSGVSEAFNVEPIPMFGTVSTGDGDNQRQQYKQNALTSEVFKGAAAKGASKALDRVAQFYLDMAQSIFPVVEIGAGRSVDLMLTTGVNLKGLGEK